MEKSPDDQMEMGMCRKTVGQKKTDKQSSIYHHYAENSSQ